MKKINLDAIKNKNLSEMPEDMLKEINGGCSGLILRSDCGGSVVYWLGEIDRCRYDCWSYVKNNVYDEVKKRQCYFKTKFSIERENGGRSYNIHCRTWD